MKKTFFVLLSLLLVFTFATSSFAFFGLNTFEPTATVNQVEQNISLNSNEDPTIHGSDVITTRTDWTPNRAEDPDRTNALFVDGIAGNDGQCIKVTRSFTLFPDSFFGGDYFVSVDFYPVNIESFTGMLFDYNDGSSSSTDTPHPNATAGARDKAHDYEYPLHTGYGYTFVKGKTNVVRLFVNASQTGTVDYVDFDLGFDVTAGWHNYAMYVDTAALRAYFYVDKTLKAYFDFTETYGNIFNAAGENILKETNFFFGNKSACLTILGEACEVYFDNLEVNEWKELPSTASAKLVAASFDTIKINGEMASFQAQDGNASGALDTINRTIEDAAKSEVKTITLRGWAGFDAKIQQFGYKIGSNKPVFGDFAVETQQDVKNAGGENAQRFEIEIPMTGVTGTQKIVAMVKFADGSTLEITPATAENCPNTSFTYVGKATEILEYTDDAHGSCIDSEIYYDKDGVEMTDAFRDDLGVISRLTVRGWVGYNTAEVAEYGYVIEGHEPVFCGTKTDVLDTDPVKESQNGGELASRFAITFNFSKDLGLYKGEQELYLVAKLTTGEVYKITENVYVFTVEEGETAPTKAPTVTATPGPEATATTAPAEETATTAPATETEAPKATDAPADEKKSGCGSIIGSAAAIIAISAVALFVTKKKEATNE